MAWNAKTGLRDFGLQGPERRGGHSPEQADIRISETINTTSDVELNSKNLSNIVEGCCSHMILNLALPISGSFGLAWNIELSVPLLELRSGCRFWIENSYFLLSCDLRHGNFVKPARSIGLFAHIVTHGKSVGSLLHGTMRLVI